MAPAREIPGFHYDETRKKYFRIQPDHRAPEGSSHSKSAIKAAQQINHLEQLRQSRQEREKKGQIRRYDPASYTSLSLALRLGASRRHVLASLSENYVSRFERRSAMLGGGNGRLEAFTVTSRGKVYMGRSVGGGYAVECTTAVSGTVEIGRRMAHRGKGSATMADMDDRYIVSSCGSTLTIIPLPVFNDTTSEDDDPVTTHTHYPDLTITDIATTPYQPQSPTIALATTSGLYIAPFSMNSPSTSRVPTRCPSLTKEQLTTTFLTPHTIISSERSGTINLTDIRVPSTVHRLRHSSAVNGVTLRSRCDSQLIVSGLGTVALYDLRYTKGLNSSTNSRKRQRGGGGGGRGGIGSYAPSRPLVPFYMPTTHRSEHYAPGKNIVYSSTLDVTFVLCQLSSSTLLDNNSNIKTTTTNAGSGSILLYDTPTGRLLSSPISNHLLTHTRGLSLSRVRDGPESLFVAEAAGLHEWRVDLGWDGNCDGNADDGGDRDEDRSQGAIPMARAGSVKGEIIWRQRTFDLLRSRFPPDAQSDVVELWRRGDKGPSLV